MSRPKPTKLKILEGNPGKKKLNRSEPEPPPGLPEMPLWLSEFPVAVSEWNREGAILSGMGTLTTADAGIFAMRCYLADQIQEMASEIKTEGRVAYTAKMDSLGNEVMDAKTNPKAIQIKNLMTEYRQIGSLLGLDSSSRTKLSVDMEAGKKSKFSDLIGVTGGKKQ